MIDLNIRFFGSFIYRAGTREIILPVEEDVKQAGKTIKNYLEETYGFKPPYNIMINKSSLVGAVKRNIVLKEGDEARVFPYLGGG